MTGRIAILPTLTIAALAACSLAQAKPAASDAFPAVLTGLRDQNGRPFAAASVADRFVLVNFIFTGCGSTCPTQVQQLSRFERSLPPALRAKLAIVSISVDPTHDTPPALRRYAKAMAVDGRHWQFLTGTMPQIVRVTRAFSAMRPDQVDTAFHTSEVRLFDRRRRMIQRYAGAPLAATQLREDLLALSAARS